MKNRAFLIVAFFLFIVPSVFASGDFLAYSDSKVNVCGCRPAERGIFINNGEFENFFVIESGGSGADFVRVFPSSFSLGPGENAVVSEFINTPCDGGNYDLDIGIRTSDAYKLITQQISSSVCSNIDAGLFVQNNSGCRCNRFVYVFRINNTGTYTESYTFSLDKYSEFASMSSTRLTVGANKSGLASLFLRPDCTVPSSQFVFRVNAEKSSFSQAIPLRFNVNNSCTGNFTAAPMPYGVGNYLRDSLVYFPIVILLFLLIWIGFFLFRRKENSNESRKYKWESKFSLERRRKDRGFSIPKVIFLVIAVVLALLIIALLFRGFLMAAPVRNETVSTHINITQKNVTVGNLSSLPLALAGKVAFERVKSFVTTYYLYIAIGLVALVLIIAGLELARGK